MSLTKQLNSKSNIKQTTNADYPVTPRQPVLARDHQESTAGQTNIVMPFSIDTINNPDSLILSVDGKILSRGSNYDYVFSAVDSFGFSNTVTLNYALAAGLNIEYIKLGLKKETEFVQDARFNNTYENIDQALQGFVRTSDLMVATTAIGTPAAGTFHSSIINRASITDLTKDLKARMGIERIMTQQIYQIQNEFGPTGESVFGLTNDSIGQVRFVGSSWASVVTNGGNQVGANLNTDYVEITFYGTDLNILLYYVSGAGDFRVSIDGAAETAVTFSAASSILTNRNYSTNQLLRVASALSPGTHTVKVRLNSAGTQNLNLYGFEVINTTSTITVNPGSSYIAGKKLTNSTIQSLSYNSSFESGTLGTRGGRVVVYQKADGTIAKAVQPVDAAQANMASANHQNEEVARVFHWREFGAGRTDDFSLDTAANRYIGFTLDDGTTTLKVDEASFNNSANVIELGISTSSRVTITFIGTGLDFIRRDTVSGSAQATYAVNGGIVQSGISETNSTAMRTQKIVSGLPYGTHTVYLQRSTFGNFGVSGFIVYQPKKPSIPVGAVELADYNIMANYVATTSTNAFALSPGVIYKSASREMVYTGTWAATFDSNGRHILSISTTTNGSTASYTFFGTGVEVYAKCNTTPATGTISIDGTLYTGAATTLGNGSWTPGTSTWSLAPFTGNYARLQISGLTLGVHTVTFTTTSAANTINFYGVDVVTPIHSYDPNIPYSQQNTLLIGSQGIMDTRQTSALRGTVAQVKNVSQAVGITSGPTTTATSPVPMPDMSVTHVNKTGRIRISYSAIVRHSAINGEAYIRIYVDGSPIGSYKEYQAYSGGSNGTISDLLSISVSPGVHKVDLYWFGTTGTTTTSLTNRNLTVEEV